MRAPTHSVHTQEGKNRFETKTDQLPLIGLTPEEKTLRALYKKLNFFPTQGWAIRAVVDQLCAEQLLTPGATVLDPCAGQDHMARVLREMGLQVDAADIHDYGFGHRIEDFQSADYGDRTYDFVFMNPPFGHENDRKNAPTIADRFIAKALTLAPEVLMFGRLAFLTPGIRYGVMSTKLDAIYTFCERTTCALGRITKKSGATDYAWFHFSAARDRHSDRAVIHSFGPGTRKRFTRKGDEA